MKYAVTFGQKYRFETHPVNSRIGPNSYVLFDGADEDDARLSICNALGDKWAFMCRFDDDFFEQITLYNLHEVKL